MNTVWKFPLQVLGFQQVRMPLPAQPLSVQSQGDAACLWAEVDPEGEQVNVDIVIVGTGHPIPTVKHYQHLRHISTFQMHGGALVFHAYEVVNRAH